MNYAYVTTNLLDLWNKPQFNSKRLSQLFFGEVVGLGKADHGYVRVTQLDGYTGWADIRFLRRVKKSEAESYGKSTKHVVTIEKARLIGNGEHESPSPHFLFYGTPVRLRTVRSKTVIVLPDGVTLQLRVNSVKPVMLGGNVRLSGAQIVHEARRFLGAPYLWGGVTTVGFDCSGLVRTVLSRFGIGVPRDTKDQITVGVEVERDAVRTGDLLFFKRHVGFAIGRDRVIHSSVGGSGVRINSLKPGADDYRPDLDRDFATARRIL
ncbi:MAG: C40 family peptidase [candidate division Zixibacteria bacterium]|nr:C40 family peptidase [candidate division Zixibacteria bacterium]